MPAPSPVACILAAAVPHREAAIVAAAREVVAQVHEDGGPLRASLAGLVVAVAALTEIEEQLAREETRR